MHEDTKINLTNGQSIEICSRDPLTSLQETPTTYVVREHRDASAIPWTAPRPSATEYKDTVIQKTQVANVEKVRQKD